MISRHAALPLMAASLALQVASARAYENPDRFGHPVDQGGGGDRHFTGSPLDAYTCKVCHASQHPVPVAVYGLPEVAYEPGATYHVLIVWPPELERVALNLEMSDLAGNPLGSWSAPEIATLPAADRCSNPLSDAPTGTRVRQTPGTRALVTMSECGQHQLSLDWTAPSAIDPTGGRPAPDAWFSGSLLSSNHDAKLSGDSVADFSQLLMVETNHNVASADVRARCSFGPPGARDSWWNGAFLLVFLALLAALRRPRSHPARRSARRR